MTIKIFSSSSELSNFGAEYIKEVINSNPKSVLGLATGASPIGVYKRLVEMYEAGEVSFKDITTVNLDEYLGLAPSHPQSYRHFMEENLFSKIDIKSENTHLPIGNGENPLESCREYDRLLESLPRDFQLLGIGRNGHIAFNEPSECYSRSASLVALTKSTMEANSRFFSESEKIPTKAITMGIAQIFAAKKILLIATGKSKAKAIEMMVKGEITPYCPASVLALHRDVTILLDKEAASRL